MLDQALRVPKRTVLLPIARRVNISPTAFTLAGLVTGILAATLAALGQPVWATLLWATNRILDGLDGEIARAHNRQSDLGGYLDIMADLLIYAVIPLGLVLASPTQLEWLALAILLASFYINSGSWMYLASLLEKRGHGAASRGEKTSITMPSGLIEGTETIIFYTLFFLFPGFIVPLFLLMSILVLFTVGQRLVWASGKL